MTKADHLSPDSRTLQVVKSHNVRVKGLQVAIAIAGATRIRTVSNTMSSATELIDTKLRFGFRDVP